MRPGNPRTSTSRPRKPAPTTMIAAKVATSQNPSSIPAMSMTALSCPCVLSTFLVVEGNDRVLVEARLALAAERPDHDADEQDNERDEIDRVVHDAMARRQRC